MAIQLRPYQVQAIDRTYRWLRENTGNPCIEIPTAGGKTAIMAQICRDAVSRWDSRVLILAHVKELLIQARAQLQNLAPDLFLKTGLYSAGLRSRDTSQPVIIAGIQSAYQRAVEFGKIDIVMVDECHRIPLSGDGMYRTFLDELKIINPKIRLLGLTATPYRLGDGMVCGPDNILNEICYSVSVKKLITDGYLCPLKSRGTQDAKVNTQNLHVRRGEYVASEVSELMDQETLISRACSEIISLTRSRKSILIFSAGVQHGHHVAEELKRQTNERVETIFGDTLFEDRDQAIADFKSQKYRFLINCEVLTLGFDAPGIDCVVMLRPTASPGLYYQMVGRGFRLSPSKEDCLILDFANNILTHGPVDAIEVHTPQSNSDETAPPAKECPECLSLIHAAYQVCPECGYEFDEMREPQHEDRASNANVISSDDITEHEVLNTYYSIHEKNESRTMRVDYEVNFQNFISEFICFEHTGYALRKAEKWWRDRSNWPMPETVSEAVTLAREGAVAKCNKIATRPEGRFERIIGWSIEEKPEHVENISKKHDFLEDVPF